MNKIEQNIFEGSWNGMVHVCNLHHTFGAGIARQVKNLYPQAYDADLRTKKADPNKLSSFSYAKVKNREIFNLYAQKGIGSNGAPLNRNLQYDAFYDGVFKICQCIQSNNAIVQYKLAFPYQIGCGLAGGEWQIVFSILKNVESYFSNIDFDIYKYTP